MKKLLLFIFLMPSLAFAAYTEFYCQSGGSNLNACSTTNNTAAYTSTNGNWSTATNIFTPTDGSTPASSVNVGDFASIYVDGATVGVFIGRVTTVAAGVNGGITISSTSRAGSAPSTSATARSIKVGGACKGPNGSDAFPLNLSSIGNIVNTSSDPVRFNLKNDATYSPTVGVSIGGVITVQGYSSSVGDGGRAIIDAATTTITVLTINAGGTVITDIIAQSSATTGTGDGFQSTAIGAVFTRCVANNMRGNGFNFANSGNIAIECESYANNKSNTSGNAGFLLSSLGVAMYCIAHDNTGSNTDGFATTAGVTGPTFLNCIADTNGRHGFSVNTSATQTSLIQCDSYNNTTDGFKILNTTTSALARIQNCNFIKNGGWGVNTALTTGRLVGTFSNNGFGSGTAANSSGTTNNTDNLTISGSITYGSNLLPWVDAPNGDFRINLAAANGTGRGVFIETASGYAGSIGYPDVGAVQSKTGPGGTFTKETSYAAGQ